MLYSEMGALCGNENSLYVAESGHPKMIFPKSIFLKRKSICTSQNRKRLSPCLLQIDAQCARLKSKCRNKDQETVVLGFLLEGFC
eukprot:TRINITY_DN1942_c0_g1_i1.p1 TRINITY_DN1942_c0_g1~~TRINITY_DN1942_c0_g1_i1.p1  ORF type:complete len:85 (-),score=5.58 TRINITY_DN1942_c0_g1_i1:145-399(-)